MPCLTDKTTPVASLGHAAGGRGPGRAARLLGAAQDARGGRRLRPDRVSVRRDEHTAGEDCRGAGTVRRDDFVVRRLDTADTSRLCSGQEISLA